jgi:hypothetical protein
MRLISAKYIVIVTLFALYLVPASMFCNNIMSIICRNMDSDVFRNEYRFESYKNMHRCKENRRMSRHQGKVHTKTIVALTSGSGECERVCEGTPFQKRKNDGKNIAAESPEGSQESDLPVEIVLEVRPRDIPAVLEIVEANHTYISFLSIVPSLCTDIDSSSLLLLTSQPNTGGERQDILAGTCVEQHRLATQLLEDTTLSSILLAAHVVDGPPARSLSLAAAAIAARYAYWHCTRPAPGEPASCAALGGCHRRCWWRARRPPAVHLRAAGVRRRAAAALMRRLEAAGVPLPPPGAAPAAASESCRGDLSGLAASVLALPGRPGYLTGLCPPLPALLGS